MKESNVRLHAVQASSIDLKSEDLGVAKVPKLIDYSKLTPAEATSQSAINESSKNVQHFESIDDPHKSMVRLIDTMFDYLQVFADEANKSNNDPRLSLHWQRATLEKLKSTKSWLKPTTQELPAFTGKLYTCDWSLIIKGTNELVTSYIIPSDRVISFNSEPEIYSPYLTINHVRNDSNFNWQIDNAIITHEHVKELAKKLLERLLSSAKSRKWGQSVFCMQSIGMGVPELENRELEIAKNLNGTASDPEQFLVDLMKTASEQAKPKIDEFKIIAEPPIQREPVAINRAEFKVDPVLPTQGESASINPNGKSGPKHDLQTFEDALLSLPNILAQKLGQLTKEGGEAFNRHDLKGAQDILTLSHHLDEFKNKTEEIITAFKIQH